MSTQKEGIAKYGQALQKIRQALDNGDTEAAKQALNEADQHQQQMADQANRGETQQQGAQGQQGQQSRR